MTAVAEDTLAKLRSLMTEVRTPNESDAVFKDECIYSFDTPYSEGGLYVSCKSWRGFGRDYYTLDHNLNGNNIYLHEIIPSGILITLKLVRGVIKVHYHGSSLPPNTMIIYVKRYCNTVASDEEAVVC